MPVAPIKRVPTLFLKAVIVVIAVAVIALCIFLLPEIWRVVLREMPEYPRFTYPALVGLSATALPFFAALSQAFLLLHYIDRNIAFSEPSVRALRRIKYCAIAMSAFYACGLPLLFLIAELDDAPGLGAIALAIVCAPLVVATFAAVLQTLVRAAVAIKTENDFTI